ncbi:hypothetical protein NCC49_002977 [Naganishia albida]|nr:hypothetical protein NCC49_002977 [Naganishia albida]
MPEDQSQTLVLGWIKPYINEDLTPTFRFDVDSLDHLENLLNSLWGQRAFLMAHPSTEFENQVEEVTSTLNMLLHKCCAHRDSPNKFPRETVLEKRKQFLEALKTLLCDPANSSDGKRKQWIERFVIDVVLHPPPPVATWTKAATSMWKDVVSLSRSFFSTESGTGKTEAESDGNEDDCALTVQNYAAAASSARRRKASAILASTPDGA